MVAKAKVKGMTEKGRHDVVKKSKWMCGLMDPYGKGVSEWTNE